MDPPPELEGRHPLWINRSLLNEATYEEDLLKCGDAAFSVLYMDVKYMDIRALNHVLKFAKQGLPVCIKQQPQQPGKVKSAIFEDRLVALMGLSNVRTELGEVFENPPLVTGDSLPAYWCRVDDNVHYIFFAHPLAKDLKYPLTSGQSRSALLTREVEINVAGKTYNLTLEFKPYQSLMIKVGADGSISFIDIEFVPKDPVVKPKTEEKMYF